MVNGVICKSLERLRMLFPLISSFLFDTHIEVIDQKDELGFIAAITKSKLLKQERKEKYVLQINAEAIKNLKGSKEKLLSGILLHEILHVALAHLNMLENYYLAEFKKDPNLQMIWNICVDYPINEIVRSFDEVDLPQNAVSFKTIQMLASTLNVPSHLIIEGETSLYYFELFRKYYLQKKQEMNQSLKGQNGNGKATQSEKISENSKSGKTFSDNKKDNNGNKNEKESENMHINKNKNLDELDEKIKELYEQSKLNDNHDVFYEENNENTMEETTEEIIEKWNNENIEKAWKEQFLKEVAKKIKEIQNNIKGQGHQSLGAVLKFFEKIFAFKFTIPNADEKIRQSLVALNFTEQENKSTIHPKTFLPLMYNRKNKTLSLYHKKKKKVFPVNIVFAFDTSGSMSPQDVLTSLAGTFDLLRKLQKKCKEDNVDFKIKHIEFDSKICNNVEFDNIEAYLEFLATKKEYQGGGGTLYKPVLESFFSDPTLKGKSYLFIITDGEEYDIKKDLTTILSKYKNSSNRYIFFVLTPNGVENSLREAISTLSSYDKNKICLTKLQQKQK